MQQPKHTFEIALFSILEHIVQHGIRISHPHNETFGSDQNSTNFSTKMHWIWKTKLQFFCCHPLDCYLMLRNKKKASKKNLPNCIFHLYTANLALPVKKTYLEKLEPLHETTSMKTGA